jgi:hypothetical protein
MLSAEPHLNPVLGNGHSPMLPATRDGVDALEIIESTSL